MRLVKLISYRVNISQYKLSSAVCIYILKKNGKIRLFSIPTIVDRVQAIIKNALQPKSKFRADVGSYSFCPSKSCANAPEKLYRI
jgi:RNA-directed DNA polymerase